MFRLIYSFNIINHYLWTQILSDSSREKPNKALPVRIACRYSNFEWLIAKLFTFKSVDNFHERYKSKQLLEVEVA